MPTTYNKQQVNDKLSNLLNQKEELLKQRELYQPGTKERKEIQSAINKLSPKIAYLKKSPLADRKLFQKKEDTEPLKKFHLTNLLTKEFKKVEEKAKHLIDNSKTEEEKRILNEQLYFASLRYKYSYC